MTRRSRSALAFRIEPAERIGDPIEFIRGEHDRQHQICDRLEDLPNFLEAELDPGHARQILDFLSSDLPRHVEDEENDLFPALAQRCRRVEGLDLILSQLMAEHELDLALVEPLISELRTILAAGAPEDRGRFLTNLRVFADTQRRHLLWENRVVLPLAERHLTREDRDKIAAKMGERRGTAALGSVRE